MTEEPQRPSERVSPLHDEHRAAGATFTDFAGWQMPLRYTSDLAEHHAVRSAAGLFDLSHMGEVVVSGPQAGVALDFALAGQLSTIDEGQAKYSLLLAESGGIIDDVIVYRTGADRYLVVANAGNRSVVADELRTRVGGFDAHVADESDDTALIAIQGPASLEILGDTPGFDIQRSSPSSDDVTQALREVRNYRFTHGTFEGEPVLVARTGYTGEDGFELYVAPRAATALWRALLESGSPHGLIPAGLASRDTLRLEAGMPLYGHEISLETQPSQAGLGRVVAFSKGSDFIGRAAVETGPADDAPVLVGLAAEGRRAGRAGYDVLDGMGSDAAVVGRITSGVLSPTLGHPIALASVHPRAATIGTELAIDVRGTRIPASVVALPFYKRAK